MRVKITNWKKLSASLLVVVAVFALLSLQTKAASQSDAIAVRVMPNTNHDSIETWYANQGFTGSPQSLIVDGYEAIRDGRTVFVNAANLDSINKNIYTNIYLISYNQESETKTLDILGQLVSHWKFNNNLSDTGHCSISNIHCTADTDCATGYICSITNGSSYNKGKCILKNDKVCTIDSDCPVNLFCDNLKSRAIRDVKRLGELNQINKALESYKTASGNYPGLQSGTYVLGTSISVWPSWKETLWAQLGLSQLLVDPINTLGACDGYDPVTCWNNKTNTFVSSINLFLPSGSYAFIYNAAKNGINYTLCSVFETKALGYDTSDKKISANSCSVSTSSLGSNTNTPPSIVSSYTNGEAGKEFSGYVKVVDKEGDLISWKLEVSSPTPWLNGGWQSGSSLIPVLQDTGDSNQKKIYSPRAGNAGSYEMILTLTDSRGAATSTKLTVNISNTNKPRIEAEDANYFIDPINPLKYTFSVEGSNSKPIYTLAPLNPSLGAINSAVIAAVKSAAVTSVGLNKNKIDFSVLLPKSPTITQDLVVPFRITATANGVPSTKDINFNLKIEKPSLDFQCENMARIGVTYPISGNPCFLGQATSGNHSLTYSVTSNIGGLVIAPAGDKIYLKADPILKTDAVGNYPVTITVKNEYGVSNSKSFNLQLNNFCGDGIKQQPNTESRGGSSNSGVEECDIFQGIITNNISTSSSLQYGCTTESPAPYPIVDNNSCVFKAADQGGGYCGDGVCQFKIKADGKSKAMENCWNCQQDCGNCLVSLESSADNEQMAYYNGKLLYKTTNVNTVGTKKVPLVLGKNVFSFWAQDLTDENYGLAFKLIAGASTTAAVSYANSNLFQEFSTKAPLPSNSRLVCKFAQRSGDLGTPSSSVYDPTIVQGSFLNWTGLDYDDSDNSWLATVINIKKSWFEGVPYIWPDATHDSGAAVYCRLSFDYKPYSMTTCVPDCNGKTCGSDGCGGYCGTADGSCKTTQRCADGKCICKPDCNGKTCGSDGCGGVCGGGTGLCPTTTGNIWYQYSTKSFGWTASSTVEQKCYNGVCGCKPNCTNRTCGSDGCGGFCGTCDSGYFCNDINQCQSKCRDLGIECGPSPVDKVSCGTCSTGACIDGRCTSGKTNIQVSADNGHTTYLNGVEVSGHLYPNNLAKELSGNDWTKTQAFSMNNIKQGENIFAVFATNDADTSNSNNKCTANKYGFSATLNLFVGNNSTPSIKMTTNDATGWKCSDTKASGYEWASDSDFYANGANSNWTPAALTPYIGIDSQTGNLGPNSSGNNLNYKQIWWNGSYSDNCKEASVYCRYTFNTDNIKDLPCTPVCSNKCSGPDNCGGYCFASCNTGECGAVTPNTCGTKTCTPKCDGVCGGDDDCNGICPNNCTSGQTCGGAGVYNVCG